MISISQAVEQIISQLNLLLEKAHSQLTASPEKIVSRSCLQDGLFDGVGIALENTLNHEKLRLKVQTSSCEHEFYISAIAGLTAQTMVSEFIPNLSAAVLSWFLPQQGNKFWQHTVYVQFTYPGQFGAPLSDHSVLLQVTDEPRKQALRQVISDYLEQSVWQAKFPPKKLDILFLSEHLLCPALYPELDVAQVEEVFKHILELTKVSAKLQKQVASLFVDSLQNWADKIFLAKYYQQLEPRFGSSLFFQIFPDKDIGPRNQQAFAEADQAGLALLVYAARLILQYKASYSHSAGIEYLNYAAELGYANAKQILKVGSGAISPELTQLKHQQVECQANDVAATITIKIKQETAQAYEQALLFLSRLLNAGFPHSYKILFSSKVKAVFPVSKIGKSKTLQFFANAAQYAQIFPALAEYAKTAIAQYEWYTDQEGEHCAMPGSYAVFALVLADDKYLPLLKYYLKNVDDEHQMLHQAFLKTLLENKGINQNNAAIVIKGITCVNGCFKAKVAAIFNNQESLALLCKHTAKLDKYLLEIVIYFIWGSTAALSKAQKQATDKIKPLLTELLERCSH